MGTIVTIFRSRLAPGPQDDYDATDTRMDELVVQMPGYISHKFFTADDGEQMTIVEFETADTQAAWRTHPEHIEAQRKGRLKYYSEYDIKVCEVKHANAFKRDTKK